MKYYIAAFLIVSIIPSYADCTGCSSNNPNIIFNTEPYYKPQPSFTIYDNREIFRMSPGACLRGPLYFLDRDGKKLFELKEGVYFPTSCNTK